MTISIVNHNNTVPNSSHDYFDVTIDEDQILTLCTACPSMVDSWISEILHIHTQRLHSLIVGLDVEWSPNFRPNQQNPVATLQLCVGHRCLIFQLIYASKIPQSLVDFLASDSFKFVGVGIGQDVEKLCDDYDLNVTNTVDLRVLAAEEMEQRSLRNAGLKELARVVLGKQIDKPRKVTMSRWDKQWLTEDQVQYACVDAFLSFKIGRSLM